jgi:gluconokinase
MPCVGSPKTDEQTFLEMNRLAKEIPPGSDGLYFLPLFGGDRCPHYRPDARGAVLGLTFSHGRAHMVRALMEGLAYHLYSVYRMLAPDTEPDLVVTGGILKSPVWLSIISDLFGKDLYLPGVQEATAWGGVLIGLRAIGELKSMEEVSGYITTSGMQEPNVRNKSVYRNLINEYDEIYTKVYG